MQLTVIARDPSSGELRTIEVDGTDYEDAKAKALADVPDGWIALSIRRV